MNNNFPTLGSYNRKLIENFLRSTEEYKKSKNFENLIIQSQLLQNIEGLEQNKKNEISIALDNARESHYFLSLTSEDEALVLIKRLIKILQKSKLLSDINLKNITIQ